VDVSVAGCTVVVAVLDCTGAAVELVELVRPTGVVFFVNFFPAAVVVDAEVVDNGVVVTTLVGAAIVEVDVDVVAEVGAGSLADTVLLLLRTISMYFLTDPLRFITTVSDTPSSPLLLLLTSLLLLMTSPLLLLLFLERLTMFGNSSLVVVLDVTMRLSTGTTAGDRDDTCGKLLLLSAAVLLLLFRLKSKHKFGTAHCRLFQRLLPKQYVTN
jgi:hypothetical protein